jgi:hypothetical protein
MRADRGVSHVAVLKAIKAGRIEKEPDGEQSIPRRPMLPWERNTNQSAKTKATKAKRNVTTRKSSQMHDRKRMSARRSSTSGPSFAQSRAIKEAYNARLAKLSYEEKSGALVRTDSGQGRVVQHAARPARPRPEFARSPRAASGGGDGPEESSAICLRRNCAPS